MNEKISKRRIQITDLQKQEIEEKEETNKLIRIRNSFTSGSYLYLCVVVFKTERHDLFTG